ncbi:uncharacterized protein G2W53_032371 [Senna tora]|uniref:Uncharacterized protein n=1 Tax=Senna tora TaxID=362788 RepID=A0A834SYS5_9FABA|nr:uncharacterized protein G2W53_032371 [Senna tora]
MSTISSSFFALSPNLLLSLLPSLSPPFNSLPSSTLSSNLFLSFLSSEILVLFPSLSSLSLLLSSMCSLSFLLCECNECPLSTDSSLSLLDSSRSESHDSSRFVPRSFGLSLLPSLSLPGSILIGSMMLVVVVAGIGITVALVIAVVAPVLVVSIAFAFAFSVAVSVISVFSGSLGGSIFLKMCIHFRVSERDSCTLVY